MTVQHSIDTKRKIRPVILAASRQRRLWPLSTPETPFCLRSIGMRSPLLSRSLQALEATTSFSAPIIILAEPASRLGISEITRIRPDAKIILVPEGVGSGISSLIATIHIMNSCRSEHIALIPGSFTANDPVEALKSLASAGDNHIKANPTILMARRFSTHNKLLHLELGSRIAGTGLFDLIDVKVPGLTEVAKAMEETKTLVSISGAALTSPHSLMRHVQSSFQTTYVACHNAMNLAQTNGNVIRPQQDFLSLAGRPSIRDYFQSILPNVQAYIGNPDWRTVETLDDPIFAEHATPPHLPVSIVGFEDYKVIASNDGILVLKNGHEDRVKERYPNVVSNNTTGRKELTLRFTA